MPNRLWTRNELILAIKLYCELPFGKMHAGNPEIIKLAELIGRTPSAVTYKLVNFASFDPSLKSRGIRGMGNTSRLDKEIWNEFYDNWEELSYKSAKLLSSLKEKPIETIYNIDESELPKKGEERMQIVKTRVNQSFFRTTVLASYNYKCCITGLNDPSLLIAGHIVRWSEDVQNRLNPRNGLCLNALHDRAFENGLITVNSDYKIQISNTLKEKEDEVVKDFFLKYDDKELILPSRFLPDKQFLEKHYAKYNK